MDPTSVKMFFQYNTVRVDCKKFTALYRSSPKRGVGDNITCENRIYNHACKPKRP